MIRRFRTDQNGFTLIEVMVAALVSVLAFTALGVVLLGGVNQATADVRQAQLIDVADQQIEQVRAEVAADGFTALAMSSAPTAAATSSTVQSTWTNPYAFLQTSASCGTSNEYLEIESNYDDISTSSPANPPPGFNAWSNCGTDGEPIQVLASSALVQQQATAAACSTSTATISSPCTESLGGAVTVTIYTFVTDTYVGCGESGSVSCPTATSGTVTSCASTNFPTSSASSTPCGDARRVTVVVVPSGELHASRSTPIYVSSIFTNPTPSTNQQGTGIGLRLSVGV